MAVAVQQERSQGFILYPKHDQYPQPVPFASLPGAAGQLPSWQQKKLELEMASAGVNDDVDEKDAQEHQSSSSPVTQPQSRAPSSAQPAAPPPASSQPLPKQSSLRRSGSALFASLRSPSSSRKASNSNSINSRSRTASANGVHSPSPNGNGTAMLNGNSSFVQVHRDPSGGIGTSPRASSKKRSSSLMMLFKKHFGIENHPEYNPATAAARSSASSAPRSSHAAGTGGGGANKLKKSPSQRLAATSSSRYGNTNINGSATNRKTRSSGFADKMRLASGKLSTKAKQTWKRFNSRSKPEEVPQTWEEWRAAYARGQIDISDLPPPPPNQNRSNREGESSATSNDENPYEQQYLPAPMPEDFRRRQLAFNRLDIEGKRGGIKPSEIAVPAGEESLPDTLEGHPAFRDIVSRARETFDSAISILTVFNENRQLFLAETGLGGMKEVPREVTFCSHAVLQSPPEPFVLNDTHKDWRFANSPLVQQYGCRAYYGVPLLAPDFSGSDDDPVPIGTLCIIDNKPREQFTVEQRQKMNDLALLAQKTIANWSRARFRARLDAMERSFQLWKSEAVALADGPGSNLGLYQSARENKYTLPSANPAKRSIEYSDPGANGALDRSLYNEVPANGANGTGTSPAMYVSQVPQAHDKTPKAVTEGTTSGTAVPSTPPTKSGEVAAQKAFNASPVSMTNKQKIYDISTRLVGDSLELTLVYILRLNLAPVPRASDANNNENGAQGEDEVPVQSLSLVSSFGLPSPEPAFDAVLHMKALRSEEGGLLYQNPRADELRAGERMPQTEEVEYASALLVPVCESEASGYVLAGFTDDPERVFERSDLEYMTTIASELAIYLMD